jgi:hypothetical protein
MISNDLTGDDQANFIPDLEFFEQEISRYGVSLAETL